MESILKRIFIFANFVLNFNLLPLVGLEPTRQKAPRPQRDTSTIPSQGLYFSFYLKYVKKNTFQNDIIK